MVAYTKITAKYLTNISVILSFAERWFNIVPI